MDMDYFRAVQNATGIDTYRDLKVNDAVINFERQFRRSINFVYDALRNGVQQEFIIVPITDNRGGRTMCTAYAHIDEELNTGDIIFWNNCYWLAVDKDTRTQLYNCATLYICEETMNFMVDGEIMSYPYYVYNLNQSLDENEFIITSGTSRRIKMRHDENTSRLCVNMRFMDKDVGGVPQVWKITDITTQSGLLEVKTEKDEYSADTDNAELRVCNYYEPGHGGDDTDEPEPGGDDTGKLLLTGAETLKVGKTATYTANMAVSFSAENIDGSGNTYVELSNVTDTSITLKALAAGKYVMLTATSKTDASSSSSLVIQTTSAF